MSSISLQSVRDLMEANSVKGTTLVAQGQGFAVSFTVGMEQRYLASKREAIRRFKTVESALKLLHELGIRQATMDFRDWRPYDRELL